MFSSSLIRRRSLPSEITTYDLVKCLALAIMLVDHIGIFFFPGDLWWRAVGRSCLPIWFFLIGYASTRYIGRDVWLGGGLLVANTLIFGGSIFPLNILFTMIAIRLVIDRLGALMFRNWEILLYMTTALSVLYLPSFMILEYGTSGLLLALMGYAVRHRDRIAAGDVAQKAFCLYAVAFFALTQAILFNILEGMTSPQMKLTCFLVGLSGLLMYHFRPLILQGMTQRLPRFLSAVITFGGRYTLEIYVIHLIILKFIVALTAGSGYDWFEWRVI